jgi:hypothetical protein
MTAPIVTSGIDQVTVEPLPERGWVVRFRSASAGLHHQLYVNGRLADFTDSPDQRRFFLEDPGRPLAIRICAVDAGYRSADLRDFLPDEEPDPSWVFRARVVRSIFNRPGDVAEILGDHATGEPALTPLASAEIWPAWQARWAFGEDRFGAGCFGHDGANAPGMIAGAFGAGPFGMDADLIELEAFLLEEGTHQIVMRTRGRDGQTSDSDPRYVSADLPGPRPAGLTPVAYDPQTHQLTLQIH